MCLVGALRKQGHEDHQVRKGEEPLIGADACRFRSARDESEMTFLGEIVEMVHTNSRQCSNLGIGEDLLTRFYGNHC